jgi:hypothetical protein
MPGPGNGPVRSVGQGGLLPDSPLLPLVHAALVRSYAALFAAVRH